MPYTQQQIKTKKQKMAWVIGGIIVILLGLFFFQSGNENSIVAIAPTGSPSSVFIDRDRKKPLQSTSSPTEYSVGSGEHQVLVAEDGHWPWSDNVTVSFGQTTNASPFLIEQTGRRVIQTTSAVREALASAQQEAVPDSDNPIISPDQNIRVFVTDETNIIAQWTAGTSSAPDYFSCREGTCGVSVYNQAPVSQIAFYPNRSDVIFFATDVGVYAIEINPTGETQNFQPVAEGVQRPAFTIQDNNIFVLSSNGRVTVNGI